MKSKLNVLLTLGFVALLGLQTESQAYVEKNDTLRKRRRQCT